MSLDTTSRVPPERIGVLRDEPVREDGDYVLYWMIAQRRLRRNFALQRALSICNQARRLLAQGTQFRSPGIGRYRGHYTQK